MILDYLVFAALGKLIIFLLQTFPFHKLPIIGNWFVDGKFLHELLSCGLCTGFWVYITLSLFMRMNILNIYYPVLSEVATASVTTFLVHLIAIGWKDKFSTIMVN